MNTMNMTNDTMQTEYYLEPSVPDYRGEGVPATMAVWLDRGDGQPPGLAVEPVLLYPAGAGSSPGGNWVSPVARLAPTASAAARRYHRRHVGGWTRPQPSELARGASANA